MKTKDGGKTWDVRCMIDETSICLSSIYFIDKDSGWAVGGSYKIFKTIDGGETWNMTTEENSNTLYSVFFL